MARKTWKESVWKKGEKIWVGSSGAVNLCFEGPKGEVHIILHSTGNVSVYFAEGGKWTTIRPAVYLEA